MIIICRYAAILFKKQKYVSGQHRVNLKIVCRENYKYEVQEKSPANQAVTMQQLAEEYWRWHIFLTDFSLDMMVKVLKYYFTMLRDRNMKMSQSVIPFIYELSLAKS